MADLSLGHWRVGRHQSRNLYYTPDGTADREEFRGVMFDPDEGPRIVAALNGSHSPELAKAMDLLADFVNNESCHYDHNNECQEHGWYDETGDPDWKCPHQRAKLFLESHGVDWHNR